jgi:long-chain acyl-CoA synthetase
MIDGILRSSAARHGDRPALVSGERTLSYLQLDSAATNLAADLSGRGIGPGDRIGIHAPNSWQWIVAYHAIAKLGGVVVPVNALLTPDEVDFILGDCGAVAVFGSADSLGRLDRADAAPAAARLSFDGFDDLVARPSTTFAGPAIGADDTVTIGYTSGTTGRPKGAVQTHRAVFANIALTATVHVRTASDVVVTPLPAPHVYGNVAINSLLLVGGIVVLLERFDPAEVLAAIERHRATMFEGVPAMYSMIEATPEWASADLSSLRIATVGGQTIATSVIDEWERASGAPLLELWGMTEISGLGSTHPAYSPNVPGSIGVSLPGVGLRVGRLDDPTAEANPDEPGELQVRGPIVMREYFGRPEATTEAFTADGWLLTGDIATADRHGYLRIVDRRKDMILTGGYNVYPAEVERVVAACPGVALVAVGRVADDRLGEVPKAYVVLKPGASLTAEGIIAACTERLARYKVPREVAFVDDLPKTSTGKLLRRELGKLDA